MRYGTSHRGEHHRRNIACRALRELEHRGVRVAPKLAAREREIFVRIGAVEADRNGIDNSLELGRDVASVDE